MLVFAYLVVVEVTVSFNVRREGGGVRGGGGGIVVPKLGHNNTIKTKDVVTAHGQAYNSDDIFPNVKRTKDRRKGEEREEQGDQEFV